MSNSAIVNGQLQLLILKEEVFQIDEAEFNLVFPRSSLVLNPVLVCLRI